MAVGLGVGASALGSKNDSEQRILAAIYLTALRATGATVTDRTGIGGPMLAYAALRSDQTDVYSRYTGSAWATTYGKTDAVTDLRELFTRVKPAALPIGMSWLALSRRTPPTPLPHWWK